MKFMNYSFKTLNILFSLVLYFVIPRVSEAQVLVISKNKNNKTHKMVLKILHEDMDLPKSIFKHRYQDDCRIRNEDKQKFDLVICTKKNGKLEFPVYNKAILENSYKSFF